MNNHLKSYIKVTSFILSSFFILNLLLIKVVTEPYDWYRLLNMEGVIAGALFLNIIQLFFMIYLPKKELFDIINFITLLSIAILFIIQRDFILSTPTIIDLKYIIMKFGIIGVSFYSIPFLISNYSKNYKSLLKILTIFSIIYIFTNLFTHKFKISFVGFIITAIFLSILYYVSGKEKKE